MSQGAIGCTWFGEWSEVVATCVRWSREQHHRHQIAWDAAQGGWRVTCIRPYSKEARA